MPTVSMCGCRPARLSLIHCMKIGSKQPGSSCEYPGTPGRHDHSFVPFRKTRYSPVGGDGQSRMVAPFVMKFGPARSASTIFSASVVGWAGIRVCANTREGQNHSKATATDATRIVFNMTSLPFSLFVRLQRYLPYQSDRYFAMCVRKAGVA